MPAGNHYHGSMPKAAAAVLGWCTKSTLRRAWDVDLITHSLVISLQEHPGAAPFFS
jgi:hypothetical protein